MIETPRLMLLPHTAESLRAMMAGKESYFQVTRLGLADGLREMFHSPDISPTWLDRLKSSSGADIWNLGFAVVLKGGNLAIGLAGFKGPPDGNAAVEIGYGIAPGFQGKGYATEAAAALAAFALRQENVNTVRAHTLPLPGASTRLLEKCGFVRLGEVVDPEDGPVWRWERKRPDSNAL